MGDLSQHASSPQFAKRQMCRSIRVLVVEDLEPFWRLRSFRPAGSAGLTVVNTDEMRTPVSEGIQYSPKWCAAWAIPFVVMLIYVSPSTFRKSFRTVTGTRQKTAWVCYLSPDRSKVKNPLRMGGIG